MKKLITICFLMASVFTALSQSTISGQIYNDPDGLANGITSTGNISQTLFAYAVKYENALDQNSGVIVGGAQVNPDGTYAIQNITEFGASFKVIISTDGQYNTQGLMIYYPLPQSWTNGNLLPIGWLQIQDYIGDGNDIDADGLSGFFQFQPVLCDCFIDPDCCRNGPTNLNKTNVDFVISASNSCGLPLPSWQSVGSEVYNKSNPTAFIGNFVLDACLNCTSTNVEIIPSSAGTIDLNGAITWSNVYYGAVQLKGIYTNACGSTESVINLAAVDLAWTSPASFTLCEGQSFDFRDIATSSGFLNLRYNLVSATGTYMGNVSTFPLNPINTNTTGYYQLYGTIGNTLVKSSIIQIEVIPMPNITLSPAITQVYANAPNSQFTTNNLPGITINWSISPANSGTITNGGLVDWDDSYSGSATITASYTNSCGTKTKAITTNIIAPCPTPYIAFNNNSPVCVGQPIAFTVTLNVVENFTIYEPNEIPVLGSGMPLTIGNTTINDAGIYTLKVSHCGQQFNLQTTVVINPPPPTINFISGATTLTQNAPDETYSTNAPVENTVTYTLLPANAGIISGGGVVNWDANFTGTATVTATMSNSCGSKTAERFVTINANSSPVIISFTSNSPLCEGQNLILTPVFSLPNLTYTIVRHNGIVIENARFDNVSYNENGLYTLKVVVNGIEYLASTNVVVNERPLVFNTNLDTLVYKNAGNYLLGRGKEGRTYQITPASAGTISEEGEIDWNENFVGDATFIGTAVNICGSITETIIISVIELPTIEFKVLESVVCEGKPLTIQYAVSDPTAVLTISSPLGPSNILYQNTGYFTFSSAEPFFSGEYILSVKVNNIEFIRKIDVLVNLNAEFIDYISGPEYLIQDSPNTIYTARKNSGSFRYNSKLLYDLEPLEAGTINEMGVVDWNPAFYGQAIIKAINAGVCDSTSSIIYITVFSKLTCPPNILVPVASGTLQKVVNFNFPTYPFGNLIQTEGIQSGQEFPFGTTTNSYTFYNGFQNLTCSFNIILYPETAPLVQSAIIPNAYPDPVSGNYSISSALFEVTVPTGEVVSGLLITTFPDGAESITINGITYGPSAPGSRIKAGKINASINTFTPFPPGGVIVITNNLGRPVQPIIINPKEGITQIHIDYVALNGNNIQSPEPASISLIFVSTPPVCNLNITAPNSLCEKSEIQITVLDFGSETSGEWVSNNPTIASIAADGKIRGISEGNATFTFTQDGTGCTVTSNLINILPSPSITVTPGPASVCFQSNQNIVFMGNKGLTSFTVNYSINAGESLSVSTENGIASINLKSYEAGHYVIELKSIVAPNSCQTLLTDRLEFDVKPNPIIICPADFSICKNAVAITLSASPAGGTYSGDGISGNTFEPSNLAAGQHIISYSVSENGCTATCNFIITVIQNASASITYPSESVCKLLTTFSPTLTGTTGGTFTSSNGLSISSSGVIDPSASNAGNYVVSYIVDGACGITVTTSITINPINALTATAIITNLTCNNSGNIGGIIQAVSGGSGNYTYVWSNNAITKDLSGLNTGTYSVTISDVNGCANPIIKTYSITKPDAVAVSVGAITQACNGINGTAVLAATGGTPGYTFTAPNGATVSGTSFEAPAGTYIITASDSKGCTGTATVLISQCPITNTAICTFTKSFFGNTSRITCINGTQTSSTQLMTNALNESGGSFIFGSLANNRTFTITLSDINIGGNNAPIYKMMPGSGNTSAKFGTGGGSYSNTSSWSKVPLSNNGKIANNLFANTIALFFNLKNSRNLGSVLINNIIYTQAQTACGSNIGTGPISNYQIPGSVVAYLSNTANGYSKTVSGLFQLANDALGGKNGLPALASIDSAIETINKAFDGCKILVLAPVIQISTASSRMQSTEIKEIEQENQYFIVENPVEDGLIKITTSANNPKYSVLDALGHKLEFETTNNSKNTTIKLKNFVSGVYYLIQELDNKIQTRKILLK